MVRYACCLSWPDWPTLSLETKQLSFVSVRLERWASFDCCFAQSRWLRNELFWKASFYQDVLLSQMLKQFCFFGIYLWIEVGRKQWGVEGEADCKVDLAEPGSIHWRALVHPITIRKPPVKLRSPGLCAPALLCPWVWAMTGQARPWRNTMTWHIIVFVTASVHNSILETTQLRAT